MAIVHSEDKLVELACVALNDGAADGAREKWEAVARRVVAELAGRIKADAYLEQRGREAGLALAAEAVLETLSGQGSPADIIEYLQEADSPGGELRAAIRASSVARFKTRG